MQLKRLTAVFVLLFSMASIAKGESIMDQCRAEARAVEAAAQARDNLNQPSWEELLKQHPILEEIKKRDGRGFLYAQLIYLGIINKNATPRALMMDSFDTCKSGGFACSIYGEGCGPKKDR